MTISDLRVRLQISGADAIRSALGTVRQGLDATVSAVQRARAGVSNFASTLRDEASRSAQSYAGHLQALSLAAHGAGVALAAMEAKSAFDIAVKFDSLARSLATTSMSADDLRNKFANLQAIASLPGIGFEEAVQGAARLEGVRLSAELAQRALVGLSNAVALSSGTPEDLGEVVRQLTQIQSLGRVTAENLNVILERAPSISNALLNAFGTASAEQIAENFKGDAFINRFVASLDTLPRAMGGVANDMQNFSQRIERALLPLGQGLIEGLRAVTPYVNFVFDRVETRLTELGMLISAVAKSGLVERILTPILDSFNLLANAGDSVVGAMTKIQGGTLGALESLENLRWQVNAADQALKGLGGQGQPAAASPFIEGLVNGIATVSAAFLNLPVVITQVKTFAHDLWSTFKTDLGMIGEWFGTIYDTITLNTTGFFTNLGQTWAHFWAERENEIRSFVGKMATLLKSISENTSPYLGDGMKKQLGGWADKLQEYSKPVPVPTVTPYTPFPTPNLEALVQRLKPLPDLPKIDLLAGRQEIFDAIMANYRTLDMVPQGLQFNGGQMRRAGLNEEGGLLKEIAKNTDRAANRLEATSLRRAALGGGQLAALGVTPAEIRGGMVIGRGGPANVRGANSEAMARQQAQWIEEQIKKGVRRELARLTGAGPGAR